MVTADQATSNDQRVANDVEGGELQQAGVDREAVGAHKLLEEAVEVEIDKGGEVPDVFFARRQVMHKAADNSCSGEERHRHPFTAEHVGH